MCCGLDENLGMPALRPRGQGSDLYVSAGGVDEGLLVVRLNQSTRASA